MAKNNKLINNLVEIARRNREQLTLEASKIDTPQIYSAVAIALWRTLDGTEETKADAIKMIFAESQKVWFECDEKEISIEEMCEHETGFNIMNEVCEKNG